VARDDRTIAPDPTPGHMLYGGAIVPPEDSVALLVDKDEVTQAEV
jgi:hypothetical protein